MIVPTAKEYFERRDKEILDKDIGGFNHDSTIQELMIEFASLHVEAALKAKVKAMRKKSQEDSSFSIGELDAITENAYPLTNIK